MASSKLATTNTTATKAGMPLSLTLERVCEIGADFKNSESGNPAVSRAPRLDALSNQRVKRVGSRKPDSEEQIIES